MSALAELLAEVLPLVDSCGDSRVSDRIRAVLAEEAEDGGADKPLRKLVIEEVAGYGWMVSSGPLFSNRLYKDEVLGVVAALLYGNGVLPYLGSYEWNLRFVTRHAPIALLPAVATPMPLSDFVIHHRELIADARGI